MNPDLVRLDGKVVLVTGAGAGIGHATARLIAARGARVIVSDTNLETGHSTVDAIRRDGGTAHFVAANVALESDVEALVRKTVELFGGIDCAVNNAGIGPDKQSIHEADMSAFDRVLSVNLRGVMLCMKHEIRQMLEQGRSGSIVNMGSVNSVRPQQRCAGYVAAKHAVIGLTKAGSLDYAGQGIRINAVLPGAIDTPMLRDALRNLGADEATFAAALSLFGRLGKPGEVAEACAWLCSDASSYVTGHSLAIDGGYLSR